MTVYGYARVSTAGQSLNEQKDTLKGSGATKSDKISRSRFNKYESNIKRTLGFDKEDSDFQFFSSETKYGKDEVWQWIEAHLNQM